MLNETNIFIQHKAQLTEQGGSHLCSSIFCTQYICFQEIKKHTSKVPMLANYYIWDKTFGT